MARNRGAMMVLQLACLALAAVSVLASGVVGLHEVEWVATTDNTQSAVSTAIHTSDGYSYLTGVFHAATSFGAYTLVGVPQATNVPYDAYLVGELFVTQVNTETGDFEFASQSHVTAGYGLTPTDIVEKTNQGVVVTGLFNGNVTFGSGTDSVFLSNLPATTGHGFDCFLVSFDELGDLAWALQLHAQDFWSGAYVDEDGSEDVVVVGLFSLDIFLDGSTTLSSPAGAYNMFMIRYSMTGALKWAAQTTGTGDAYVEPGAMHLTLDGDLVVAGSFRGCAAFDPADPATVTCACDGTGCISFYLAHYDGVTASLDWIQTFGVGTTAVGPRSLADIDMVLGEQENIYVTGSFEGTIYVTPSMALTSTGGRDIFVVKYTTNGDVEFGTRLGGDGDDRPYNIGFDGTRNEIVIAGQLEDVTSFGGKLLNLTKGLFFTKYSSDGALVLVEGIEGELYPSGGIAVAQDEGVLVAGSFSGTLEIDEQEIKTSPEGVFTVFVFKWLETGGSASVDGTKSDKHGWTIVLVVVLCVALVGGVATSGYFAVRRRTASRGYEELQAMNVNSDGGRVVSYGAAGDGDGGRDGGHLATMAASPAELSSDSLSEA